MLGAARITEAALWHRPIMPYMKERAGSTDSKRRFVPGPRAVVLIEGARQLSKPGSTMIEDHPKGSALTPARGASCCPRRLCSSSISRQPLGAEGGTRKSPAIHAPITSMMGSGHVTAGSITSFGRTRWSCGGHGNTRARAGPLSLPLTRPCGPRENGSLGL